MTAQYLQSQNMEFDYKWIYGNWVDTTSNTAKHMKEAINNNLVFIGAASQATVALTYNLNYVYVDSGWRDVK